MENDGQRPVAQWFFPPDRRLARPVRVAFFAAGLAALGAIYLLTRSAELQTLVLFALAFGVLPTLRYRFGRGDTLPEIKDRNAPLGVWALSILFAIAWGGATFLAVPRAAGPWFLWWLMMWPWIEVHTHLAERELRRHGTAGWQPTRPLRDSILAGVAVVPFVVGIELADSGDLTAAIVNGLMCGLIVFAVGGTFARLGRRARESR
jgi:hypothetical protein